MQKSEKCKFIHSFMTERLFSEKMITIKILSTTDKIILVFNGLF